jgi:hypothetical protein
MNISQNIDNFRPDTVITLAAGEHKTVNQTGRYFILKSNSLTTDVQVAIGNSQHYTAWPILWSFQTRSLDDYFEKVKIYNPAVVPMTVDFFISTDWIDNKSAEVIGTISVSDITNGTNTPASIIVQPKGGVLINNAAAVNVGGGVVGIPVTGQTFVTGDSITITGTINYNAVYSVLASSTTNQVNITAAYVAETFDGVNDTIKLTVPRSIPADPTRKELHIANHSASRKVFWGDSNVDAAAYRGIPIHFESIYIIACADLIYLTCAAAAGIAGCRVSWANKTKT